MIGLILLYILLYAIASWTYWQEGVHLSLKKYTLAFILMSIVYKLVELYIQEKNMSEKINVTLKCNKCETHLAENQTNWLCLPGFNLEGLFCKDCVVENISESLLEMKS